jgi:hypothetical protein
MNSTNLLIKCLDGVSRIAELDDAAPFRLTRAAFSTSKSKLKQSGGTYSTSLKLPKESQINNIIFSGKGDIKSFARFYIGQRYEATIQENGAQVARGTFVLQSVSSSYFIGTFFDTNAAWIDLLSKVKLNELGYQGGLPTWLADFDGAVSFDQLNNLSNRQTDIVVPTAFYNNRPIRDYLDLTQGQIWGEYDGTDLIIPPIALPDDLPTLTQFSDRLAYGLTFDMFPPAVYYRNVIEKCFEAIGMSVECSLFYEDWFNALIMTFSGNKYKYNWGRLGYVFAPTPNVQQSGAVGGNDDFDKVKLTEAQDNSGLEPHYPSLPDNGNTYDQWATELQYEFKYADIIKHEIRSDVIDPVTLGNSFDRLGSYKVPTDGKYNIKAVSQYKNTIQSTTYFTDNITSQWIWDGRLLYENFGAQNAVPSRFGWDDNVLLIVRGSMSPETELNLYKWMNGQTTPHTTEKSNIIAYFSPKRYVTLGNVPDAVGAPYSDFNEQVQIGTAMQGVSPWVGHSVTSAAPPMVSESYAHIEIEADLLEGDEISIYWVALSNIYGLAADGVPPFYSWAGANSQQEFGQETTDPAQDNDLGNWSITPLCGTDKIDIATNLPNMTAKDFIAKFIDDWQLEFNVQDNTVKLYTQAQYYEGEPHDITSRVDFGQPWTAEPLDIPSDWIVGYDNDKNDKLLIQNVKDSCGNIQSDAVDYGNVKINSNNDSNGGTIENKSMFSATRFITSPIVLNPQGYGLQTLPHTIHTSTHPIYPNITINTGFTIDYSDGNYDLTAQFPSIQSEESNRVKNFGDWAAEFNNKVRLLYHLGTVNHYLSPPYNTGYKTLIDMPRADDIQYIAADKHWFTPTISQFDGENNTLTGISYPTLRFDTVAGRYVRFFENLIEAYNKGEQLTVRMNVSSYDWYILKRIGNVRLLGQRYRLMLIKDYDTTGENAAIIKLFKLS